MPNRTLLRAGMIGGVLLAGVVGARAVFDWTPARIVLERDTLRLYGAGVLRYDYRVENSRGRSLDWVDPTVTHSASGIVATTRYSLNCLREGATDLTIAIDDVTARMHVSCRFAVGFHGTQEVGMSIGDAPHAVSFTARFADGTVERVRPLGLGVGDTLVARVRGDSVVAWRVGRTRLHVELGGSRTSLLVQVMDVLARDTLELLPGESRQWPLVAGRYDIIVRNLAPGPRSFAELEMVAEGTRCVPSRQGRDMIHCLVSDTGAIGVHNTNARGGMRSPRTAVTIVRTH